MARHAGEGDSVHVLILAEGLTSRSEERNRGSHETALSELAQTAKGANEILGVRSCELLDFADNRMDGADLLDVVKAVEKRIDALRPDVIYTHFPGDLNVDHRIVSQAVATAARPVPGQTIKEIYFFEVQSSTEWQINPSANGFLANHFVSLFPTPDSRYMSKKLEALALYSSEMRDFPHARSVRAVEALAALRGATIGTEAAEAFMTGRVIR
jgi:LmbE family N-acetylglucosaminyl deacetylase